MFCEVDNLLSCESRGLNYSAEKDKAQKFSDMRIFKQLARSIPNEMEKPNVWKSNESLDKASLAQDGSNEGVRSPARCER